MSLWKENRKWNKVFRVCRNPSKSIHTVDSLLKVIYQRILKYRYRLDASSYCGQVTWVEFRTGLRSIFKSSRKRVSDHHDNFVQSATNSKEKTSRLFWVELVSYKLTLLKEIRPALSCGFCFLVDVTVIVNFTVVRPLISILDPISRSEIPHAVF